MEQHTTPSATPATRGSVRAGFWQQWLPIFLIMLSLVAWASIHALGAYLSERGERAVLKALFVLLAMAIFLSGWGALLWLRYRRLQRNETGEEPDTPGH